MIRGLLILCPFLPACLFLDPSQNKLYEHLLNGYDPMIHPSKLGRKQQLSTTINFFIYHIAVVDKADPKLKFNGFLRLQWFDQRIAWNSADFGGISEFSLPMDYKIWTPAILQTDVHMRNASFYDKPRARTNFQLFFKNKPAIALITHSYQIHGEMDCFTGESFPREKLQCQIFFVNGARLEEETFKSVSQHIVLKNIFINDVDSPRLNGWRVINTRQQKLVYAVDEYNARSAIQCSIIIQRDDFPLYFVIIMPLIVLGTLIAGAWLSRPGMSMWTCGAAVYNIQLFLDDFVKRIPTYVDEDDDRIGPVIVYLWVTIILTAIFHFWMLTSPKTILICSRWCSTRLSTVIKRNVSPVIFLELFRLFIALLHSFYFILLLFFL